MSAPLVLSPTCAEILALLKTGPHSSVQLARATGSLAITTRVSELRTVLQQRGLQIHTELARPTRRGPNKRRMAIYTLTRIRTQPSTRSRRGKQTADGTKSTEPVMADIQRLTDDQWAQLRDRLMHELGPNIAEDVVKEMKKERAARRKPSRGGEPPAA